jgi:hypothetical protein
MENNCHFVCSRGLLKSTTFHSNSPKSSCSNDTGYLMDMLNGTMFDGMSIYVCSDLLPFFMDKIVPRLRHRFYLLSGDSDKTPEGIDHPLLIKWFSQNNIGTHPKIVQTPIGLDYHTLSNDPTYPWRIQGEGHLPKEQESILMQLKTCQPFDQRKYGRLIYVNFSRRQEIDNDRTIALRDIPQHLLHKFEFFIPRTENWRNITHHAFVLSPFGMGFDCHRTWETLALGSIPIVRSQKFAKMFEGLPVLIVENWSDVNDELLKKTLADFKTRTFQYEKMELSYWVKQFTQN